MEHKRRISIVTGNVYFAQAVIINRLFLIYKMKTSTVMAIASNMNMITSVTISLFIFIFPKSFISIYWQSKIQIRN